VEENFLTQLISEPTRGGASFHLLFTNTEELWGHVVVGGCLGLRDHEMTEFLVHGEVKKGVGKTTTMDFQREVLDYLGHWLRGSPGRES